VLLPALVGGAVGYAISKRGNHAGGTRFRFVSVAAMIGAAVGAACAILLFRF
jgi:hypothetical protein